MAIAAKKAVSWLERNMDLIELKGQAFDTAIVAYALMKIKASVAERAYVALSKKYLLDFIFIKPTDERTCACVL